MSYKKIGDFPTNSRIKITYDAQGKADIKFDYPDNQRQVKSLWKSSGIGLPALFLSILTIIVVYLLILNSVPVDYPKNCTGQMLINNKTLDTTGINVFCNNITKYYFFQYQKNIFFSGSWTVEQTDGEILRIIIVGLSVMIAYLLLIYLYGQLLALIVRKTKKGLEIYPEWNKKIHDKSWEAKFTECPDNLTIELPLFSNIYMDYEAEEEFSDFLESVEIKEHDFTYYPTRGFKLRKHWRNKRKGVPNVYLWKAVFKFKQKPTKGFLKINWT